MRRRKLHEARARPPRKVPEILPEDLASHVASATPHSDVTLKTLVFSDDWDDLRFPVQGINPAGAASAPTVDTSLTTVTGAFLFSGSAENVIAGIAQMPHAWKRESSIKPHIHWSKPTGSASAVTWELYYRHIGNPGDALAAWVGPVSATATIGDPTVSDQQLLTYWPAITMTGLLESAILAWRVHRRGDTDADNNTARLYEVDFHYQTDKAGTNAEIPAE